MSTSTAAPSAEQTPEKQEPAKSFSSYVGSSRIEVAVWPRDEGKGFSVSISKSYQKDEQWKKGKSFFPAELPTVAALTNQAFAWITEQPA